MAQYKDQWRALVNRAMNLWDAKKGREFLDKLRDC
jgi:phenylalanine-4-hydroxylase